MPRVLAVDNFPSTADGNNTLLILNRVGGDLRNGASTIGALFGVVYDESEMPLSFDFVEHQLPVARPDRQQLPAHGSAVGDRHLSRTHGLVALVGRQ